MALTDKQIRAAKPQEKAYKLTDSGNMFLLVNTNGAKYWRLRYRLEGKENILALGVYPEVSLAEARQKRDDAKKLIAQGISPNKKKQESATQAVSVYTFEYVARAWHSSNKKWSKNHSDRILRGLEQELFPTLGNRQVADLKTYDLLIPIKAVEKSGRLEVASRLQQRTNAIMRFAVQSGWIDHNPAQDMLGAITVRNRIHRPALPFERIPELLQRIDSYIGRALTRYAVQLTLLIFIRSSELRFARWNEIDFDNAMWTIPAEREELEGVRHSHRGSKMRTAHMVPLSHQALDILRKIQKLSGDYPLIFIGDKDPFKPMSENTINNALRLMGYDTKTEVCGHGFRTIACSSLVESGLWAEDVVERQMSHKERNNVRAAYIHVAQHLDERRLMMQWWADFLDANRSGLVTPYDFAKR